MMWLKRCFDLCVSGLALILLSPLLVAVIFVVKCTSPGPVFYCSQRVGKDNNLFSMPKFRSMRIDTPVVATHLLTNPDQFLTPVGAWLRKTSIDELPQLWSILRGDMSLVGPRPALFNQEDLIGLRTQNNIHKLKPGLTGWAQINGRDDIPIPQKVQLDQYYLKHWSFMLDLKIIGLTFLQVIRSKNISH